MLRPLPFPSAQQLVWIAPPPTKCGLSCATYSTDAYDEFRMYTRSYQDVTGYFAFSSPGNLSLNLGGAPIPATSIDVIANFFQLLGVQPAMGRVFTADDARNGAAPVILLSDAWWRRQFNADPNIIGKAFDMNGHQTTVIGVLPATFDFGAVFAPGTKVDAITPLNLYGPPRDWGNIITLIGRLKPGVTLAQAQQDAASAATAHVLEQQISAILRLLQRCRRPRSAQGLRQRQAAPLPRRPLVRRRRHPPHRLRQSLQPAPRPLCRALQGVRHARRSRRQPRPHRPPVASLKASSSPAPAPSSVCCSPSLSSLGSRIRAPIALPLLSTLHIDGAALGWTVLIAVVSAVLFGLVPGLRMAGGNLHETLKDSSAGSGQSRKHERIRSVLVVSEVALACMLLVGAGLLLRSFMHVLDVDLGFQPERAAAIKVDYDDSVPGDKTGDLTTQKRTAIFQQVLARVGAIPGIEGAGISDYLPLSQNRAWGTALPQGRQAPRQCRAVRSSTSSLRAICTPWARASRPRLHLVRRSS